MRKWLFNQKAKFCEMDRWKVSCNVVFGKNDKKEKTQMGEIVLMSLSCLSVWYPDFTHSQHINTKRNLCAIEMYVKTNPTSKTFYKLFLVIMLLLLLRIDLIQNRSPLSNRQIKAQETDLPAPSPAFIDTCTGFSLFLLQRYWLLFIAPLSPTY